MARQNDISVHSVGRAGVAYLHFGCVRLAYTLERETSFALVCRSLSYQVGYSYLIYICNRQRRNDLETTCYCVDGRTISKHHLRCHHFTVYFIQTLGKRKLIQMVFHKLIAISFDHAHHTFPGYRSLVAGVILETYLPVCEYDQTTTEPIPSTHPTS